VTLQFYFIALFVVALFVVVFGLVVYWAVADGPPVGERLKIWLPALLFALASVTAVWGASWLLLGPSRSRALFLAALMVAARGRHIGPVTVVDGVYLFTLCAAVVFVICLRVRTRQVQRRSDQAIGQAIAQWHHQNKPPA